MVSQFSTPMIIGIAMTALVVINTWQIKSISDKAYEKGVAVSDARWRQTLQEAERETFNQHIKEQKRTLIAENEAQNIQRKLEKQLSDLERHNAELETQVGNTCGLDAAHVQLLNSHAAND